MEGVPGHRPHEVGPGDGPDSGMVRQLRLVQQCARLRRGQETQRMPRHERQQILTASIRVDRAEWHIPDCRLPLSQRDKSRDVTRGIQRKNCRV